MFLTRRCRGWCIGCVEGEAVVTGGSPEPTRLPAINITRSSMPWCATTNAISEIPVRNFLTVAQRKSVWPGLDKMEPMTSRRTIIRDHGLEHKFYRFAFNELLASPDVRGFAVYPLVEAVI